MTCGWTAVNSCNGDGSSCNLDCTASSCAATCSNSCNANCTDGASCEIVAGDSASPEASREVAANRYTGAAGSDRSKRSTLLS